MNTKQFIKNTLVLLVIGLGIFSIYSFTKVTKSNTETDTYDASLFTNDTGVSQRYLSLLTDKCGGDKKAKDNKCGEGKKEAKVKKDSKCGEGKCGESKKEVKAKNDSKCGEGKCGDAKKESKKTTKDKDAKCGTGKCG